MNVVFIHLSVFIIYVFLIVPHGRALIEKSALAIPVFKIPLLALICKFFFKTAGYYSGLKNPVKKREKNQNFGTL
jgi:hypothetical protein